MNTLTRYENAASNWSKKAISLGYAAAYTDFLTNKVLRTGSVLDVGTGTGTFALSWIEAGGSPDVTLLDPSKAMLDRALSRFNALDCYPKFAICAFDDFQSEKVFDAVLASHVIEHFDDPASAMCRFAQMLPTGGRLYLNVSKPHWCNWIIWFRFRHRWFQPEEICKMARDAGLVEVRIHKFLVGPPSRTSLGYVFSKP